MSLFLDAGTTFSKIISHEELSSFTQFLIKNDRGKFFYILPSVQLKNSKVLFDKATGHMCEGVKVKTSYENEIIALANGVKPFIEPDCVILDIGSRDAKWIRFKNSKFFDLDWNTSCAAATGATVEMLLKFYDIIASDLIFIDEKYDITCGVFGLERIMDDISKGIKANVAISKFIHGIAYNVWNFTKKPEKIYLSGGFCENKCFVKSLSKYTQVFCLGRFVLVDGLDNINKI